MINPDDGALPPLTGATRDQGEQDSRVADAESASRGVSSGWERPGKRRGKPNQSGSKAVAASGHDAESATPGPRRKRRKRRRGRKVYAPGSPGSAARDNGAPPTADDTSAGFSAQEGGNPGTRGAFSPAPQRPEAREHPRHAGLRDHAANVAGARRPNAPAQVQNVYAALDLGTNNCRLLVAVPTRPGQFRVIDAFSRIVRLGEGLSATGRLSDAAMDRALEALEVCAGKLAGRKIAGARLIATEACRSAANGEEFLTRVRTETGLDLEVIDRGTEARLAVSGCGSLVGPEARGVVLFDIGGGSSEIALVDLSRRRSRRLADDIVAWTSLPVGVVSLAERFGGRVVTAESFEAMTAHVGDLLETFEGRDRLAAIMDQPGFHLLGTSGTVTTLAGVHLGLERYDRRKVDGLWLDEADVGRITEKLLSWSFEERVANACIGADRADLVLAGCAILEAIRRVWPARRLRVADRGLREGILSDLMARDGAWRRR